MSTNGNWDVRIRAYWVQAILQDTSILNDLRDFIEHPTTSPHETSNLYLASQALSRYYEPSSAPFMLSCLNSPSQDVRIAAAGSLSHSLGKTALPVLIDQLTDPSNTNKVAFAEYLYEASGQMQPGDQAAQAYLDYWQQWEKSNAAQVDEDRAKIKAIQAKGA